MKTEQLVKLGKLIALLSFVLGTIILLAYFLTASFHLISVGYVFIIISGFVSIGILTLILVKAYHQKENRRKLLITANFLLINIPIMCAYSWFAIILQDTMRITVTNRSGETIKKLKIVGCSFEEIDSLKNGENKTFWIPITGDCAIGINYLFKDEIKSATVVGYVTPKMGSKIIYLIDGKNK